MHTLKQGREEEARAKDATVGEQSSSRAAPRLAGELAHSSQGNLLSPVASEHSAEQLRPGEESPAEHAGAGLPLLWEPQPRI